MGRNIVEKRIAPAALHALKDALTHVYWYKSDLRDFLTQSLDDPRILSKLNWREYKRNIVSQLVNSLARNEDVHRGQLLRLMTQVAAVRDFGHLARLEDGKMKAARATAAVQSLRSQVSGLDVLLEEQRGIESRQREAKQRMVQATAVQRALGKLTRGYLELLKSQDRQGRGYKLEKILHRLFEIFDLDPKASFRVTGEQIDGAFTFDGTDYLLEAKWQKEPIRAGDLDSLAGKLSRKLDNTLGLYLAINGYSEAGVQQHSSGRRLTLLMDGADLMAVLEGRIDFVQLLIRKRRAAAQTGNIYLRVHKILIESG